MNKFLLIVIMHCLAQVSYANVIGADTQNFNPNPDGLDFVTVQSASTLDPGIFNLGLFFNFAANSLPLLGTVSNPQAKTKVNDTLFSGDFNFALGLTDRLQIGASFPYLFRQSIDNEDQFGRFADTGFTEFRGNAKYRFLQGAVYRVAAVLTVNKSNIANNPFTGEDPGPTWNFEFVLDRKWGEWSSAVNLGYRLRDPGSAIAEFGIEPISNQYIGSFALSRYLSAFNTLLIAELYGSLPDEEAESDVDRNQSSLELLLGMKYNLMHNLALHAGFGSEVGHGTSTADWRVYSGLNYSFGPVWKGGSKGASEKMSFVSDGNLHNYEVKTYVLSNIRFRFDSDQMLKSSQARYKKTLRLLKKSLQDIAKIEVHGHTDSLGRASYNKNLSLKRARAVAARLENDLPEVKTIEAHGYGEEKPVASNSSFQGRLKNRRVEIKLYKKVKIMHSK